MKYLTGPIKQSSNDERISESLLVLLLQDSHNNYPSHRKCDLIRVITRDYSFVIQNNSV